jgi:hypothetical protein
VTFHTFSAHSLASLDPAVSEPPIPIELSAGRERIVPVAVAFADAAILSVNAKLTARALREIATARNRFALRWEDSRCSFATRAADSPTGG